MFNLWNEPQCKTCEVIKYQRHDSRRTPSASYILLIPYQHSLLFPKWKCEAQTFSAVLIISVVVTVRLRRDECTGRTDESKIQKTADLIVKIASHRYFSSFVPYCNKRSVSILNWTVKWKRVTAFGHVCTSIIQWSKVPFHLEKPVSLNCLVSSSGFSPPYTL